MYLVDTNIWLERLLDQEKSEEVGRFLNDVSSQDLYMTDFSFHSIAIVLSRLKESQTLLRFAEDAFVNGSVHLIRLEPGDTAQILEMIEFYQFDFDDAYQYVAAEKYDFIIVSFDKAFSSTSRGRKMPRDIV